MDTLAAMDEEDLAEAMDGHSLADARAEEALEEKEPVGEQPPISVDDIDFDSLLN